MLWRVVHVALISSVLAYCLYIAITARLPKRKPLLSSHSTRYLTLPLIVTALVCLLVWGYGDSGLSDFGLNAFTETLGIIFTVLIVEQLIRGQEFKKSLPLRAAAYEDVRLLVTRVVYFWHGAYEQSVPEATPKTVAELLTKSAFELINLNLDLDSKPNVTPATTWWQYLPHQQKDFITRGERILERHAVGLDPYAYALIHAMTTRQVEPEIIGLIRRADTEMGFPRPHNLGNHFLVLDEFLASVPQLYEWCKQEKELLESYGLKIPFSVPDELPYRDAIPALYD
jgi:hypothetical protein